MPFKVEADWEERTFRLAGELDLATADELLRELRPSLATEGDIRLDLARLTFMDSSGLRTLIDVSRDLGERGRLVLRSPRGEVDEVLRMVRADTFPNVEIVADPA
jgi:anti-sigma B factor antagonist